MAVLETSRLLLRPLDEGDAGSVVSALNDLSVAQWLAPVPYPYVEQDFRLFLKHVARPGRDFTLEDRDGFAGIIGCGADLGFWLVPRAQGKGYATEAAAAALVHRFVSDPSEVTSGYFEGNTRSARVLGKLGFVEIGRREVECRALHCVRPHVDLRLSAAAFGARFKPFA
jgi:RimJ/RimL family protein N-acetyltransferase